MGKGSGDPPAAPDPRVTSQAQSDANAEGARLQARLNRVNQVGPTGKVTWSAGAPPIDRTAWENTEVAKARAAFDAQNPRTDGNTATSAWGGQAGDQASPGMDGGAGASYVPPVFDEAAFRETLRGREVPQVSGQDEWTVTTELSPEQKELYNLSTRAQTTYGNIGNTLLDNVKGALSSPVDVDWQSVRDKTMSAQRERMDPVYRAQEEDLRSRLRNSGLTEGSEGWNREFEAFNRNRNDSYIGADLRAGDYISQAIQQQAALRNMPLNEVAALLTGQQVQTPQIANVPQVGVAPTDVLGAYNTQYQGQMAQWQNRQQQQAAGLGGLFGLAGTLGSAAIGKWV